jgi:hypothetical protein
VLILQFAVALAAWRAHGIDDHCFGHVVAPVVWLSDERNHRMCGFRSPVGMVTVER